MGKLGTYLLIMSGIMLLMYYGGFIDDGNSLLVLLTDPTSMTLTDFFDDIWTALGLIGFGAIIATSIVTKNPDLAIFGSSAIAILYLGLNFVNIFTNLNGLTGGLYTPILVLIFSPLLLLFMVTILEWWRGITT